MNRNRRYIELTITFEVPVVKRMESHDQNRIDCHLEYDDATANDLISAVPLKNEKLLTTPSTNNIVDNFRAISESKSSGFQGDAYNYDQ